MEERDLREASERIVRAQKERAALDDDEALLMWRSRDPKNEIAFGHALGTWDAAHDLGTHPDYADLLGHPTLRERWVHWRSWASAAAADLLQSRYLAVASLSAAIIAALVFLYPGQFSPDRPADPHFQTRIGQVSVIALEDGSEVTLGAQSALAIAYGDDARVVKLASGEAFFSVAPNKQRPFIVEAGNTRIRVLGTKFNVNYLGDYVRVSVLQGTVEVLHADGSGEIVAGGRTPSNDLIRITAGQQALDAPGVSKPQVDSVRVREPGAWREGWLSYQDAPLGEIIADANRYRGKPIRIASPRLASERLTTSFKTSQIEEMLDQLPDTIPVRVARSADGTVDLRSR